MAASLPAGCPALEIGPGCGVLTAELAARARKVVALELDERLRPILAETLAGFSNVDVVYGDVLKLNLAAILEESFGGERAQVCANLPYGVTSPVIMRLLEERLPLCAITVMVQKEAADRLCAAPGSRLSGAITMAVWYYAEPERLFSVSRNAFYPRPKVDSAVIRLTVREQPPVSVSDETRFFGLIRAAFGQRRKTIVNAVSAGLSLPKPAVDAAVQKAGLSPLARAEQLTLPDFARLMEALAL